MNDLFFLETFVSKLLLSKKAYDDSGGASLLVRINMLNIPPLEVEEIRRTKKEDHCLYEFQAGHTRHFSMKPLELADQMKRIPLIIGVYKAGDTYPLCHVRTFLRGCACDLVSRPEDQFRPFVFKGPFELLDPGNMFAGELGLDVSIVSLGRFFVTHYTLGQNYFTTKKGPKNTEHEICEKRHAGQLFGGKYGDNIGNAGNFASTTNSTFAGDLMRDIAGILVASKYLAVGRPPPKPPRIPLVYPDLVAKPSKRKLKGKGEKKGKKK